MEQIGRQQTAILQSVEERRELSTALDLMRERLQDAVGQRDAVAGANDRLLAQMNEVSASLTARTSGDDLAATLDTVTAALAEAVTARDLATTERAELTEGSPCSSAQVKMNRERQDEMVGQLEQAIALSFGPLEQLFKKTNLDVDSLIATVRKHLFEPGRPGRTTVSTARSTTARSAPASTA